MIKLMRGNEGGYVVQRFDHIFKQIFQNKKFFYDFLKLFLPDIVDKYSITLDSIVQEKTEIISQTLKSSMIDVLYRIKSQNIDAFIFVLIEHQTTKDYLMPFRMLEYTVAIWRYYIQQHKEESKRKSFKLPPVIPIVYYEGKGRWTVERDIMDKVRKIPGYEKYVPRYEYMAIELSKLEDEWLLESDTPLSKLICVSKWDKGEFEKNKDRFFVSVKSLDEEGFYEISEVIKQLIMNSRHLDEEELEEIEEMIKEKEVEGMFARLLTSTYKEGKENGMQEGEMKAGKAFIYDILETKFGEAPEDIKEAIEDIDDLERLRFLVKKAAVASSIDEFRNELRKK